MLAPYSARTVWNEYLAPAYVAQEVSGRITALQREVKSTGQIIDISLTTNTDRLVASQERIASIFQSGMEGIEDRIHSTNYAIEGLHSDFSYGIALLLDQLAAQNDTLENIANILNKLYDATINPMRVQEREWYRNAGSQLQMGLLDKALEFFHKSESIYDADFLTQLNIGKLYLYGLNKESNVIDLPKAEKHLKLAIRYGKGLQRLNLGKAAASNVAKLTAEAYFHASTAIYVQAAEECRKKEDIVRFAIQANEKASQEFHDIQIIDGEAHEYLYGEWMCLFDDKVLGTEGALTKIEQEQYHASDKPLLEYLNKVDHLLGEFPRLEELRKRSEVLSQKYTEARNNFKKCENDVQIAEAQYEPAKKRFKDKLTEALSLAKSSIELNPALLEAYYHAAKYAALLGDKASVRDYLMAAIERDPKYAVKAALDADFDDVRRGVEVAINDMKTKNEGMVRTELDQAKQRHSSIDHSPYSFKGLEELKLAESRMERLRENTGQKIVELYVQLGYDHPWEEVRPLFSIEDIVKKEWWFEKPKELGNFNLLIERQKNEYEKILSAQKSLKSVISSLERKLAQNTFMDSADAYQELPSLSKAYKPLENAAFIIEQSRRFSELIPTLIRAYNTRVSTMESRLKNKQCVICGKSRSFLEKFFFGEPAPACGCSMYVP